ncbi:MAG: TIR domain-containing protein [Acidobacteria bacterium]|nr:TIR domain-containing protein [Acidobacteriota bacterium]
MKSVFLSYSHEDLDAAKRLEAALSSQGVDVWRDEGDLRAGDLWPKRLGEAIEGREGVVLLWSRSAEQSDFVTLEWTTALALGRPVLSCFLDKTKLPASLRSRHGISLQKDFDGGAARLAADLLGIEPPEPKAPRKEKVFAELERESEPSVQRALEMLRPLLDGSEEIHIHVDDGGGWSRRIIALALVAIALTAGWALWPEPPDDRLSLRVLRKPPESGVPASGAKTFLFEADQERDTNSFGAATFSLPAGLGPGDRVTIGVLLDDYVLYQPMNGKIALPAREAFDVELRPKGSPDFLSDASLSGLVSAALEESRALPPGAPAGQTPFANYVERWSLERGVDAQAVQTKLRQLSATPQDIAPPAPAEVNASPGPIQWLQGIFDGNSGTLELASESPDVKQQALAAAGRGDFAEAARLFESIKAWTEAGDAWKNAGELGKAQAAYDKALAAIDPKQRPYAFADLQNRRGEALQAQGDAEGAMASFGAALSVSQAPEIQRNFAGAVTAVAKEAPPEDKARLLDEASRSYDQAAKKYERFGREAERAETEVAKAAALSTRSQLVAPSEAPQLLDAAIDAQRSAAVNPLLPTADRAVVLERLSDDLLNRSRLTTGVESRRLVEEADSARRQLHVLRQRPSQ